MIIISIIIYKLDMADSNLYITLLKGGGFLEVCLAGNNTFKDIQSNDIILYTDEPGQHLAFGTKSNDMSALRITSNVVHFNQNIYLSNSLSIGNSNFLNFHNPHRVSITGLSNDMTLGPNMAFYTTQDSNHPIFQTFIGNPDNIKLNFDNFTTVFNDEVSTHQGGNFQIIKENSQLKIHSSCNNLIDDVIDWRPSLVINSNSFVSIGQSNSTFRFNLIGEDSSILGPHMAVYTDLDSNNPVYQQLNWKHDSITQAFDAYYNSNDNWVSSFSNGNFLIQKINSKLVFLSSCNLTEGSILDNDLRTALTIDSNSFIGIGTSNTTHRLTFNAEDANILGPHIAFYTSNNSNDPIFQLLNWSNDFVSMNFDSYYNSSNWISSSDKGNFKISKIDSRLVFQSASNILQGSNIDSNWMNALVINSNSYIGIGTSNTNHRITVVGPSNRLDGPHIAYFIKEDSNYPLFQQYNEQHDGINMGFDTFWNGNKWISCDSNANFLLRKNNGKLTFFSACNTSNGSFLDSKWRPSLVIDSNSFIGIGTSNTTHRLTFNAEDANMLGPHVAFYTSNNSNNPVFQLLNWSNDFVSMNFDSYYDSSNWKSSSDKGNFKISKIDSRLVFQSASNILQGSNIDSNWMNALVINSNSYIGIGTSNTNHRITVVGPSNRLDGPHIAYFIKEDSNYPLFQQYNEQHDGINMGFDTYWNNSKWISCDSNANFLLRKNNGKLTFFSACNTSNGSFLDSKWRPSLVIDSNSFIGIGTSNTTHRLTFNAEDANMLGPHVAFYTSNNSNNPVFQLLNWSNDFVSMNFDSYYDSSNWISSSEKGNFKISKIDSRLVFQSASNIPSGSNIDSNWMNALVINSNSYIGIGTSNTNHRITVVGPSNSLDGPHIAYFVKEDSNFPTFQQYNNKHDNISLGFDIFWSNNWISSSSNANFLLLKSNNRLCLNYAYSNAGSDISTILSNSFTINSNGYMGINNINPLFNLDINGVLNVNSNSYFSGSLIPNIDVIYDLGTSNKRWKDLWISGSSIDMDGLQIKKNYSNTSIMFTSNSSNLTTIWAKQLFIGDPTDSINSNVFSISSCNNSISILNLTSNLPIQTFTRINNVYFGLSNVGLGLSNSESIFHMIGNQQINPYYNRDLLDTSNILKLEQLNLNDNTKILTNWAYLNSVGNPQYFNNGGYYNNSYINCSYNSNYFSSSSNISLTSNGFTILAFIEFNKDISSNSVIFNMSNNTKFIKLYRSNISTSLSFATEEVILTTSNNIISQNEWSLFSVRYTPSNTLLEIFKNNQYLFSNGTLSNLSIASLSNCPTISAKSITSTIVGNGNINLSQLHIFNRSLTDYEFSDIKNTILNNNTSFKIKTNNDLYPPNELYENNNSWDITGFKNDGQVYSKLINYSIYGSGQYSIWANNESNNIYNLLSYNNSNWTSTTNIYNNLSNSQNPILIYIETPNNIVLSSYSIKSYSSNQTPSSWYLYASSDNSKWNFIDIRSNETTWSNTETRTYNVNTAQPNKVYRLTIFRNNSSTNNFISLQNIKLYGTQIQFQTSGKSLSLNSINNTTDLYIKGSAKITDVTTIGNKLTNTTINIFSTPSNSIASNNTLFTSSFSNAYLAFDLLSNTSWVSDINKYNSTTGAYLGSSSTLANGSNLVGEWLQMQTSNYSTLYSYEITSVNQSNAPSNLFMLGSSNGSTWTKLDNQSVSWIGSPKTLNFNVSYLENSNNFYYNYYRLIISSIGNGTNTAAIANWKVFTNNTVSPQGNSGQLIVNGSEYITDTLNVGTPIINNTEIIKINAFDLKTSYSNSVNINNYSNKLFQTNATFQPQYYKEYDPFLRFNNSYLIGNRGVLSLSNNNGFSLITTLKLTSIVPDETFILFGSNLSISRSNNTQSLVLSMYDGIYSNVAITTNNFIVQNTWNTYGINYVNNEKKAYFYKNNELMYTYSFLSNTSNIPYNNSYIGNSNNSTFDISYLYLWDTPLSNDTMSKLTNNFITNSPSIFINNNLSINDSINGSLKIKSSLNYTNYILRYPSFNLNTNDFYVNNQVYGNGRYTISNSSFYKANDIYNGYKAFQSNSATGWASECNTFFNLAGTYTGSNSIVIDNTTILGEWLQVRFPDEVLPFSYTIQPSLFPTPSTWKLAASFDSINWTSLDTQSNYSFSGSEVIFNISSNNTAYNYYGLVINKISAGSNVGINRFSVYGKTKNSMSIQDDKVVIYDKLGIGTSNPSSSLQVSGLSILSGLKIVAGLSSNLSLSSSGLIGYYTDSNGTMFSIPGSTSNQSFRFLTGSSSNEVMRISGDGNVYLSNNIYTNSLFVSSNNLTLTPSIGILGSTGDKLIIKQGTVSTHPYSLGTATNEFWNSVPTGSVYKWYINGTANLQLSSSGLICTGTVTQNGSICDIKFKNNIVNMTNGLDIINNINPVKFKWNDKMPHKLSRNKNDIGFIAQEIEKVIPEAIEDIEFDNESIKTIKYEKILPFLINSIKELNAKIDAIYKLIG
jgi:Chaperone of endosialidase